MKIILMLIFCFEYGDSIDPLSQLPHSDESNHKTTLVLSIATNISLLMKIWQKSSAFIVWLRENELLFNVSGSNDVNSFLLYLCNKNKRFDSTAVAVTVFDAISDSKVHWTHFTRKIFYQIFSASITDRHDSYVQVSSTKFQSFLFCVDLNERKKQKKTNLSETNIGTHILADLKCRVCSYFAFCTIFYCFPPNFYANKQAKQRIFQYTTNTIMANITNNNNNIEYEDDSEWKRIEPCACGPIVLPIDSSFKETLLNDQIGATFVV